MLGRHASQLRWLPLFETAGSRRQPAVGPSPRPAGALMRSPMQARRRCSSFKDVLNYHLTNT